jgi:hypothetical protein
MGGRAPADRLDGAASRIEPLAARIELARRYLRTLGPATPGSFATWAGVKPRAALAAFDALGPSLVTVRTRSE